MGYQGQAALSIPCNLARSRSSPSGNQADQSGHQKRDGLEGPHTTSKKDTMNKKKMGRSGRKKGYYDRQFQRTANNKARRSRKRIMLKHTRPKQVKRPAEHAAPAAS